MTRSDARKVARAMKRSGSFQFIELVEDFDSGDVRVQAQNRCGMRRTCETFADWERLNLMEVMAWS